MSLKSSPDAPFKRFLCWDPELVHETVHMDAASPAASTLLAVHHPARIRKRTAGSAEIGELVDEAGVLAHFLDSTYDLMLLPILGDSGTGKSHLVQWLRAQIEESPNRKVIYVPRSGTGLRGLIELILDQMEGDEKEVLRQDLQRSFQSIDKVQMPGVLLGAIAEELPNLEFEGLDRREERVRKGLAKELPPLLRDEVFRRWFLREKGVMERFVDAVLDEGVRPVEERQGFSFTAADFPTADKLPDFEKIGGFAREAFRRITSSEALREAAAEVVTGGLTRAIPRTFGLTGEVTLQSVFRKTRATLAERETELVVLIEDLTRFQGVDGELIEALLEPPIQDGKRVLCDLRAALAVTTGYYNRFHETIRTRAQYGGAEFVLDAPYGRSEGGWSPKDVADFVSRYLNATRLGAAKLEESYKGATNSERADGSWVPSACDACPHQPICHPSFKEVGDRGLYPFNPEALAAMAEAVFTKGQFDPRGLLGRVVHTVLANHATTLREGEFPSRTLEAGYPEAPTLPGSVTVDAGRYPDRDRREVLLRFWGGSPSQIGDLADGIHEAFDIPPIGSVVPFKPDGEEKKDEDGNEEEKPKVSPEKEKPAEAAARAWAGGKPMPRAAASKLQEAIHKSVLARIPWAALGISPYHAHLVGRSGIVFRAQSVHIQDALGVSTAETRVTCVLTREERDVVLLLSQAIDSGSSLSLGNGVGHAQLMEFITDLAGRVQSAIRQSVDPTDVDGFIQAVVDRLGLGSLVLGLIDDNQDDLGLAASLVDAAVDWESSDATEWNALVGELGGERELLQEVLEDFMTARQGDAPTPAVFRPDVALQRLDSWRDNVEVTAPHSLPDRLDKRLTSIRQRSLRTLAMKELDELLSISQGLGGFFSGRDSAKKLAEKLDHLFRLAEDVQCLPMSHLETNSLITVLQQADLDAWRGLGTDAPTEETPLFDLVTHLARMRTSHPRDGDKLKANLTSVLEKIESRIEHNEAQVSKSEEEQPVVAMRASIDELIRALEESPS